MDVRESMGSSRQPQTLERCASASLPNVHKASLPFVIWGDFLELVAEYQFRSSTGTPSWPIIGSVKNSAEIGYKHSIALE
jgi:hypothetical protein